jgi:hypothetical protein
VVLLLPWRRLPLLLLWTLLGVGVTCRACRQGPAVLVLVLVLLLCSDPN